LAAPNPRGVCFDFSQAVLTSFFENCMIFSETVSGKKGKL
jgi:hypothetical protein